VFRMARGRQKTVNLRRLRNQGLDLDQISDVLDRVVQENSDHIASMEFILDVEAVATRLQPETDKILKGI
jgi:hypothetical protein